MFTRQGMKQQLPFFRMHREISFDRVLRWECRWKRDYFFEKTTVKKKFS